MELPCIVSYVVTKRDNGFAILSVYLNKESPKYTPELEEMLPNQDEMGRPNNGLITAIGKNSDEFNISLNMWNPNEDAFGQQYVFVGDFISHPKYGKQFKAEFYYQDDVFSGTSGLQSFLMTLPFIKEARSKAIIAMFGLEGTIEILDNEPERLVEVRGIVERYIPGIKAAWQHNRYLRLLYGWLIEHDISPTLGYKIYDKWGKRSIDVLTDNPYKLVELRGIGFLSADGIAHKILDEINREYRLVACMKYLIDQAMYSDGHLSVPYRRLKIDGIKLIQECNHAINKDEKALEYSELFAPALKNNLDIFAPVKYLKDGSIYVGFRDVWEQEKFIAESLYKRKSKDDTGVLCVDKDLDDAARDVSEHNAFEIILDKTQKDAIRSAFQHRVTVITGGGGTGKSTICRCIVYLAQKKRMSVRLMSPTGKAAQVLAEKTKHDAGTIHRSLKMIPGDMHPREDIVEDMIIVDEISMVGVDTMSAIMYALEANPWCHIVFVGDPNQLPSVSPGCILSDIISSKCCNVVKLDTIHRQDDGSYISHIANDISNGKVASIPSEATDITYFDVNADRISSDIKNVVREYLNSNKNIDDLQIISPMKKGRCGVFAINKLMQEFMAAQNVNPACLEVSGFNKFYVGDRIIQTVNNYDKRVFNGDIGVVVDLGRKPRDPNTSDQPENFVTVDFYGDKITYFGKDIDQMMLAWVCTVHKFQGSQAKNIIFILAPEARIMANKELAYTGITRAEKHLILFSNQLMLQTAPMHSAIKKRYTHLLTLFNELSSGIDFLTCIEPKMEYTV